MSVKVRLNNKGFLAGNSMVIGGRLFEADETAQSGQQSTQANNATATPATNGQVGVTSTPAAPVQPTAQGAQTSNAQTPAPVNTATPAANGQGDQGVTTSNASTGQTQSVDQQIQAVLVKHFGGLQQTIANDLKAIQGPQWVNVVTPKDQSLNSVMGALQEYIKQNIEVAKKFVESSNQQQNASTNQNASANA